MELLSGLRFLSAGLARWSFPSGGRVLRASCAQAHSGPWWCNPSLDCTSRTPPEGKLHLARLRGAGSIASFYFITRRFLSLALQLYDTLTREKRIFEPV